jgi:Flp pilus assembly protein TadD
MMRESHVSVRSPHALAARWGCWCGLAAALALSATGCASLTNRTGTGEDIHALRVERQQKVLAEFESRRDAAQFQAAMGRLRCGDVANARSMLETIVDRNEKYLPARLALAEISLEANQASLALEHAQYVVAAAPKEAAPLHVQGLALEALGRTDEALASLQQAVDLAPENEVYRLSFQTAAQAVAAPEANATRLPQDVDATLAAATKALERNEPAESERLLSAALRYAPADARLWRALGVSHYRRGDYGEAQVVLAKAVSLDTADPLSYFLLGATLRQMGRTAEAGQQFATAARLDPRYAAWR